MAWPERNAAILVIHGVGEQAPFETLDFFTRGLRGALSERYPDVTATHRLQGHTSGWMESFVSLGRPTSEATIDVYELYWAHRMQRHASMRDVLEWLIATSDGARRFYNENTELARLYRDLEMGAFDRHDRFKLAWYLRAAGPISWLLRLGLVGRRALRMPTFGLSGPFLSVVGALISGLGGKAAKLIVDYVGDIAVYTTTDIKSRHFAIRAQILREAQDALWDLIGRYPKVIVAGHSLGSVIAYDALSRAALRMSQDRQAAQQADRFGGLLTFGSPLDKIAFFFRRRTPDSQTIRRQIQAYRFGFRARYFEADRVLHGLGAQARLVQGAAVPEALARMPWLNYWNPDDPVSGQLDYYDLDPGANVNVGLPDGPYAAMAGLGPSAAHGAYFAWPPMYKRLLDEMMR